MKLTSFVVLAAIGLAPPAWAHAHLQRAVPAEQTQAAAPDAVTLSFTQDIEAKLSSIKLQDAAGAAVAAGPADHVGGDRKTLRVTLPKLAPGTYTVDWAVISVDTHRVTGQYRFTVTP